MAAHGSSESDDVFRHLHAEQRAVIEAHIAWSSYPEGAIIYAPNDQHPALFVLQSGKVQVYKCSTELRVLQLFVLDAVTVFGELTMFGQWNSFVRAVTRCDVGRLEHAVLRDMLEHSPSLALDFMQLMGQRLGNIENTLVDLAFKHVPQRLASVLVNLAGGGVSHEPQTNAPLAIHRYTHQQLAEMIGSYRETVTKIIGEFRNAGLIQVEGEVIYLTNVKKLLELVQR
jgi:CRP-like cAMP-binding protein